MSVVLLLRKVPKKQYLSQPKWGAEAAVMGGTASGGSRKFWWGG